MANDLETATQNFAAIQQLAVHAAICMVVLAIAVAAVVEVSKSGVRTSFYRRIFKNWLREVSFKANEEFGSWMTEEKVQHWDIWKKLEIPDPRLPSPSLDYRPKLTYPSSSTKWQCSKFFDEGLQACKLPRDLFMKKIENMGQTVLEQPSMRELEFIALTEGLPPDDQQLVLTVDLLVRTQPDRLNKIMTTSDKVSGYPAAVINAQDQAAAALDRNLDDLQLRLTRLWPSTVRAFSITTGLILAFLGGWWIGGLTPNAGYWVLIFVVGIGSGVFASVVHDISTVFVRLGRP